MSLIRKHRAVLQAWACLALVTLVLASTVKCVTVLMSSCVILHGMSGKKASENFKKMFFHPLLIRHTATGSTGICLA